MRVGIILFVALYLGIVAGVAAVLKLKVRGMTAGRVAFWAGGATPASLLIVLIVLLLNLMLVWRYGCSYSNWTEFAL
ncbi:hypothetical protein [Sphingobium sp. Sx8-8]|uniref:hypothetical protein n=1 Tax=Sphingobium sp. Sx8-8 TaxID=2933617 RepID=UPI001F59CFA2|nr:hypothetical protein [Sphingobium sp. Sx8-8]